MSVTHIAEIRKTLAVPVAALIGVLVTWAITGTFNGAELSITLTALMTTIMVYGIPNQPETEEPTY